MKAVKTKLTALFMTLVMATGLFAACAPQADPENPGQNPGQNPSGPSEEMHVTQLIITSPPAKTEYKAGQLFDSSGMRLTAKWSHGVDEELSPGECVQTPDGPLAAGTTEIKFTYEGASCTQPIKVSEVEITGVTFDFSAIAPIQSLGALDLTVITVKAKYADNTEEEVLSGQYEMYEGEEKIEDPAYYDVTEGEHEITVKYDKYSDSFKFTGLEGYSVSLDDVYAGDEVGKKIEEKANFLERPSTDAGNFNHQSGDAGNYLGEVGSGAVMRFHIYSELETQAELIMNIASCRLLEGNWDSPKKMGEVQFNKAFDINVIEVDPETGMPKLTDGNETKTPIEMADNVILPGSVSKTGDKAILENCVEVSFGEITLKEGYNIIEVAVKDCEEYRDNENKVRTGNIFGFRVQLLKSDEHEHRLLKQDGKAATCSHYGYEEYYICSVCGRMFSDSDAQERIFNPIIINIDPEAHAWDREHADCTHEQVCTECGEIGEAKTAHDFGGQNICTYEGELECTMCHQTFRGGHITTWDHGTLKCVQCQKELAYKIQAEDTDTVKYVKPDGSAMGPATEYNTPAIPGNDASRVSKGAEGSHIASLESSQGWQGVTMTIPVTASEAGTYLFIIRAQANGSDGGSTPQTLSESLSYCVNPEGDSPVYTPAGGKAVAASPTGGWSEMYRWGLTVIAEVELKAGENKVVLKFNDDAERGPNIDYFMFEMKDEVRHPDAEIVITRDEGNVFAQGGGIEQDVLLPGVFVRIKVPDDKIEEFGAIYYDAEITAEMCNAAGFDTSAAGERSVEFTVKMFDREYKATFKYVVKE